MWTKSSGTFHRDELGVTTRRGEKKASNQHLLTLVVAGLPGLWAPSLHSACTLELCDCLMSSCVELEGPWQGALGTIGRLSECRVIRNPSFSLRCVNGPAASSRTSPEEGSPPSGWNWIVQTGGEAVGESHREKKRERKRKRKKIVCVPIYWLCCRDR